MPTQIDIPHEVSEKLQYYVYALRDPRSKQVFYVGKGKGGRINAHLLEADENPESERAKIQRITEIEQSGTQTDLVFLRTGIEDDQTAFIVEQAVIDAFRADHHELTNQVSGHHSSEYGLASLQTVVARYQAQPCPAIPHPVLMFKIQREWRPDLTPEEIYDKTRGHWKVAGYVRDQAVGGYALGIAYGVIYGAYRINSWFRSTKPNDEGQNRWGFTGEAAPELAHVVGTEVRDAFPNQVMYRKFLDGYPGPSAKDAE